MKTSIWLKILSVVILILLVVMAVNHSQDKNIVEHDALVLAVVIASLAIAYTGWRQIRLNEEWRRFRENEDGQEKLFREKKTIEGIIEGSPFPPLSSVGITGSCSGTRPVLI